MKSECERGLIRRESELTGARSPPPLDQTFPCIAEAVTGRNAPIGISILLELVTYAGFPNVFATYP